MNTAYAKTIPDYLWEELRLVVEAGLAPKGTLAAYNHSDHIVLNVPGRGATFMQDTMARQLALDVGADLVIFDAQDFVALAQSGEGQGKKKKRTYSIKIYYAVDINKKGTRSEIKKEKKKVKLKKKNAMYSSITIFLSHDHITIHVNFRFWNISCTCNST